MKLEEIKRLNEWDKNAGLEEMSQEHILMFLEDAKKSKYVIEKDVLLSFLDLSSDQIIYIIHTDLKEIIGYAIFERVHNNIFKRNNVFTNSSYRNKNYQVELLGRAIQEQGILICNGDSLSSLAERFWLKVSSDEDTRFRCDVFDFENNVYTKKPDIVPEKDKDNRFRYVLSLKSPMPEKYLTGKHLYEDSENEVLKNSFTTIYGIYRNFTFDFD